MFIDRGTDVILLETQCSGKFIIMPESEPLILEGTRPAIQRFMSDLNSVSCRYYTWILIPFMILSVVGAIVAMAVVPYSSIKLVVIFAAVIGITLTFPCISYCCGKRVRNRNSEILSRNNAYLDPNYQVGAEVSTFVDRWGRQYHRETGNIILRRRNLPSTIANLHQIFTEQLVLAREPEPPAHPIPIFQYDAEESSKHLATLNNNPENQTMEHIAIAHDRNQPDIPYAQPLPPLETQNQTETDQRLATSNDVHPYQIPTHPGVSGKKEDPKETGPKYA